MREEGHFDFFGDVEGVLTAVRAKLPKGGKKKAKAEAKEDEDDDEDDEEDLDDYGLNDVSEGLPSVEAPSEEKEVKVKSTKPPKAKATPKAKTPKAPKSTPTAPKPTKPPKSREVSREVEPVQVSQDDVAPVRWLLVICSSIF